MRAAALEATIEELAESGYAGLTLGAVADRAGVNKTTLYRRWGTREALVLDAMLSMAGERIPIADTGSLKGDLTALANGSAATAGSPQGQAVVRAVVAAGAHDAPLAAASHASGPSGSRSTARSSSARSRAASFRPAPTREP